MANNALEISPAVQRELKRKNLSADELLRKALNIKPEGFTTNDGRHFPEGTIFISLYKDRPVAATVTNGSIMVEGKSYTSLSSAAAHFTGRPTTNGWDFWHVKLPGKPEFIPAGKIPKAA